MKKEPTLHLPSGWVVSIVGKEQGHTISASLGGSEIEILTGPFPEGEGPEDEIFANYADMVGFDGDEDEEVIQTFTFNGRKAYGYSVFCPDERPMNVFCQEPRKGLCVLYTVIAGEDTTLDALMELVERGFRI